MSQQRDDTNIAVVDKKVVDLTRIGKDSLVNGHVAAAVKAFKQAYVYAKQIGDAKLEQAAALNLGASHIASGQPEQALRLFERIIVPLSGDLNSDLYYNYAAAYEAMNQPKDSIQWLEKAATEYNAVGDTKLYAQVKLKIAELYQGLGEQENAASCWRDASEGLDNDDHLEEKVQALVNAVLCLLKMNKMQAALDMLDMSEQAACKLPKNGKATYLNEIGLIYMECNEFRKALECFQNAKDCIPESSESHSLELATILQNMGCAYSALGDYDDAVKLLKDAKKRHTTAKNDRGRWMCCCNLVYALNQKGEEELARLYCNGLLESDQGVMQCYAMESLAALLYMQNNYTKSIQLLKAALHLGSSDPNQRLRLTEKLQRATVHLNRIIGFKKCDEVNKEEEEGGERKEEKADDAEEGEESSDDKPGETDDADDEERDYTNQPRKLHENSQKLIEAGRNINQICANLSSQQHNQQSRPGPDDPSQGSTDEEEEEESSEGEDEEEDALPRQGNEDKLMKKADQHSKTELLERRT